MEKKSKWKKLIVAFCLLLTVIFFPACGEEEGSSSPNHNGIPSDITYMVHFYTGTDELFDISSQEVKYNGKVIRPADPTLEGYIFIGWYTTITCEENTAWTFEFDTVKSDLTLYARWEKRF